MARPIKKSLLIHEITLKSVNGVDKYGEPVVTESTIKRVRLEPVKNQVMNGMDENDVSKALLFWDRVNSQDATFKTYDKVIFNGIEYTIRKINVYYAHKNLIHHLEMELT